MRLKDRESEIEAERERKKRERRAGQTNGEERFSSFLYVGKKGGENWRQKGKKHIEQIDRDGQSGGERDRLTGNGKYRREVSIRIREG